MRSIRRIRGGAGPCDGLSVKLHQRVSTLRPRHHHCFHQAPLSGETSRFQEGEIYAAATLRNEARRNGMKAGTAGLAQGHHPQVRDVCELLRNSWQAVTPDTIGIGDPIDSPQETADRQYLANAIYKIRPSGVAYHISGANVPGEGELKCMDWIKLNVKNRDESVVIIGGDADLVLQGMALSQVKNFFVCSAGPGKTGQILSLWEVVRNLEQRFPGQSEYIRTDLMVLMVLNGNDYLPKVRGITFGRCYHAYLKAKKGIHGASFLLNGAERTFSWDFLLDFFCEMAHHGDVKDVEYLDRARRFPTAGAVFHEAIDKGKLGGTNKVDIRVMALDPQEVGGSSPPSGITVETRPRWRSSTFVMGRTYDFVHATASKKAAKHQAAEFLMKELLPELYEEFSDKEAARLLEESLTNASDDRSKMEHERRKEESDSRVERYLTGLLWNVQMYVDGFPPDFYWEYGHHFAPSCAEIVAWVRKHRGQLGRIAPPVSCIPPLPCSVACLCVMPRTRHGRDCLPERLRRLVDPGSPVREALQWNERTGPFSVSKLLEALHKTAPDELEPFFAKSHARDAWKIISSQSGLGEQLTAPPSAPTGFSDLQPSRNVTVTTISGTALPPCHAWSDPSDDPELRRQPHSVLEEPYKVAFKWKPRLPRRSKPPRKRKGHRGRRSRTVVRHETQGSGQRHQREAAEGSITMTITGDFDPRSRVVHSREPLTLAPTCSRSSLTMSSHFFHCYRLKV